MWDIFFRFFLSFSHGIVIVPLIILGYLRCDQRVFFHGTCILLLSMVLNWALKVTFQVPLPVEFSEGGFAFPSGHMQAAFVFYGWLWKSFHNLSIRLGVPLVLIGIGVSLVHFGYHTYFDVWGGVGFGMLLLSVYTWLLRLKEKEFLLIVFLFSTFLMMYSGWMYNLKPVSWRAYSLLIVLIIFQHCFKFKKHFCTDERSLKARVNGSVRGLS